jgi:hypothetical protein
MDRLTALLLALGCGLLGCSESSEPGPGGGGSSGTGGTGGAQDPAWTPGTVFPTSGRPNARGLVDVRGLIHAHSVYSHDACDDAPRDPMTGEIDQVCFEDFRRGLCQAKHDFVFLTDHDSSFSETEFPEVVLHQKARGDQIVERDGSPVANWAACDDGSRALILPGCEAATMPVGLERHAGATKELRSAVYGSATAENVAALKALGAVSLVAHTEDWTPDELIELGVDGFEMYNLHANLELNIGAGIDLLGRLATPDRFPHPDLILMPIISEDPRYVDTWSAVLSRGSRSVTTLGTDCHRNTFPQLLPDGERIDSYRRMMIWFTNHVLVRPDADGRWADLQLKQALGSGRLFGAFEVLGYPRDFDFHAREGANVREMGEEASIGAGAELRVTRPAVRGLDPGAETPELTLRILRATDTGWENVAESRADLAFEPTSPGAYRAEVRIKPRHLRTHLASYGNLADTDFVWIYANPIYVVD